MAATKPPIGLMPRRIFMLQRLRDISEAIDRYIGANMQIPIEWVIEYNEIISEVQ
jgi:hypothetical protein